MWAITEISFELVDDMTDDPVVTLFVMTPAGRLTFVAEPVEQGATLVLKGVHAGRTPQCGWGGELDGDRSSVDGKDGLRWTRS